MKDIIDENSTGFFNQRGAVPTDVGTGKAIFAQDPPGQIFQMVLPRQAHLRKEDGSFEQVMVVQAEKHSMSDDVIVGYRTNDCGEGVALLNELDFEYISLAPVTI